MYIRGNMIELNGNEFATAIDAYLTAHNICVVGPRTIRVITSTDRTLARDLSVEVYVDPSGRVVDNRPTSEEL